MLSKQKALKHKFKPFRSAWRTH